MAKLKQNLPAYLCMFFVLSAFLWASGEDYKLQKAEELSRWCQAVVADRISTDQDTFHRRCGE